MTLDVGRGQNDFGRQLHKRRQRLSPHKATKAEEEYDNIAVVAGFASFFK